MRQMACVSQAWTYEIKMDKKPIKMVLFSDAGCLFVQQNH